MMNPVYWATVEEIRKIIDEPMVSRTRSDGYKYTAIEGSGLKAKKIFERYVLPWIEDKNANV